VESPLSRIKDEYALCLSKSKLDYSLYELIFNIIKESIELGKLPNGTKLPSTRLLSSTLGVSRSTIVQVYELLKLGQLIQPIPGSGYKVTFEESMKTPSKGIAASGDNFPELSRAGKSFLKSLSYLEFAANQETAFRPGLPPLDIFPVNQWKILNNLYWRHVRDSELGYVSSSGTNHLRESLANYLNFTRKIKCDPQQIIIVSGSLQSIYSIGTIFLNPGDGVIHENPTFPNIISIFQGLQADVSPVPIDEEGLDIQYFQDHFPNRKIKVIHTVPSCHYPTGVRMSIKRRQELLDFAAVHNCVIVENDYEHEVNNFQDFIPSIYSLDKDERTFFLGTFNRLLHPSIRIGYMVVPKKYLNAVESLLRHLHRFVPNSKQMVLSQFLDKNYIYKHVSNLIQIAEERKAFFCEHFEAYFGDAVPLVPSKTRSLHLLATLPDYISDQKLARHFRNNQIAVHAFSKTFVGQTAKQGLIMGYTPVKRTEIKRKIKKMQSAYHSFFRAQK